MKKIFTILAFISLTTHLAQAQDSLKYKLPHFSLEEGNIIVDVYYGFPYIGGAILKNFLLNDSSGGSNNINSIKNLNHFGAKFEYMVSKKIGIGIEYTYSALSVNYRRDIPSSTNNSIVSRNYNLNLNKHRILARINFHFATTKKLDPYGTIGIGYKRNVLTSNDPYNKEEVKNLNNTVFGLFPIAFRSGIGLRYFFNPNFGLNAEVGIGGPLVQFGITVKL